MKRTYLTSREYDALLQRQNGICCVPGCFETDGLIAEHSTPNAIYAGKPDQLMCKPCHKVKTLRDVKAIAKMKRLNVRRPPWLPHSKGELIRFSRYHAPAEAGGWIGRPASQASRPRSALLPGLRRQAQSAAGRGCNHAATTPGRGARGLTTRTPSR